VISSGDEAIVASVKNAVSSGSVATFYISHKQFEMVVRWYWTNERIARYKLQPVSGEEIARISSEFGIKDGATWYFNRRACDFCGKEYGAFEFIQQGIAEHGKEMVNFILGSKEVSVVNVNLPSFAICPQCKNIILPAAAYHMPVGYSC